MPKMRLNLHKTVRSVITSVHPDVVCQLYVSTGIQQEDARGLFQATYYEPVEIKAQFQSASPESDQFVDSIEKQTAVRKVYLYSSQDLKKRPWSLYRPLARTGDFIKDDMGQLWFVSGVLEDFTRVGWALVEVTMEPTPREFLIYQEPEPEPEPEPEDP